MSKSKNLNVRLIHLPVLDNISIQLEVSLIPYRIFPEQFRAIMCLQQHKSIYNETEDTMHLCSFLVGLVLQLEKRKLDWLQKKDLPTLLTYNIINDAFVLTIQCPNNIPLFKLIVKSLFQELFDQNNIRAASNCLKLILPEYFKTIDIKQSELLLMDQLYGKLKYFINIMYGRNNDKITAYQSTISELISKNQQFYIKKIKESQQVGEEVKSRSDLRISKYKTIDFPYKQQVFRVLFLMALNILKFEHYYSNNTIFAKRNTLSKRDVNQCSKFIRSKLMFMTEKGLVPYEKKTKYYRDKFTKSQYQQTLMKFRDKYTSLFLQSLFQQSGLTFSLFQQVHKEMVELNIKEAELNKIRDTINKMI